MCILLETEITEITEMFMESKIVLLVEDNPDDQILTVRALKKNNLDRNIIIVQDGYEALDYLFANGNFVDRDIRQQPKVILLDINLPKINGFTVLKKIRNHELTKNIPVVMLTSSSEESDIVESYNNGANSYISKPTDFNQFVTDVGNLGLYWLSLNKGIQQ